MKCSRRREGASVPDRDNRPAPVGDRQSPHAFLYARGRCARGRWRVLQFAQRRNAGRGRRVRLRQERHRAVHPAPRLDTARTHRRRRHPLRGHRSARPHREPDGGHPRQPHLDDLPGTDDLAQSAAHCRAADQRGDRAASGTVAPRRHGQRRRYAAPRAHPGTRAPCACLSASAFRRHAPARHDRHGAVVQPQGADRRRTDHRAGCHHPGADSRSDARAARHAWHRDHPDHPRHGRGRRECRPRGGDVRRPQGGRGERGRPVRTARPSLHARPAGLHPEPRSRRARRSQPHAAERDQGHGAIAVQSAEGLQLRAALRLRHRPVPRRVSAAGAARPDHWVACWHADRLLGGAA